MSPDNVGAKRGRGRPPLISRASIVHAARQRDPATLTMQSLAADMGVDRKALHYHVDSRDSLLELVAVDAFRDAVTRHDFVPEHDWLRAVVSFALITRDAALSAGAWARYVSFQTEEDLEALEPAEAATVALAEAGLDELAAGQVVRMIAELAFAAARAQADTTTAGADPQTTILERALESVDSERFTLTRRLLGQHDIGADDLFIFQLEVVARGVESLLASR